LSDGATSSGYPAGIDSVKPLSPTRVFISLGVLCALVSAVIVAAFPPSAVPRMTPVWVEIDGVDIEPGSIAFGTRTSERVPLVPLKEGANTGPQVWVGLLPPERATKLQIEFRSPKLPRLMRVAFDTSVARGAPVTLGPPDFEVDTQVGTTVFSARRTPTLMEDYRWGMTLGAWFTITLYAVFLAAFVWRMVRELRSPETLEPVRRPGQLRPVHWSLAVIAAVHLLHLVVMPAVYRSGDSNSFLTKAVAVAERGTLFLNWPEWELNKLPGYSILLALAIKLFGYHIQGFILLQHLMLCGALYSLGTALAREVPGWVAATAVLIVGFSPLQLFYAGTLMSESMMASCSIAAISALLVAVRRCEVVGWALLGFALAVGAASMARANAVLLLIPLGVAFAFRAIRGEQPWRGVLVRLVIATGVALAPVAVWSVRNYRVYGLFAPQDMAGVQTMQAVMVGGLFEPREKAFKPYYAEMSRRHANAQYIVWALRNLLFHEREVTGPEARALTRTVDAQLKSFARASIKVHAGLYGSAIVRSIAQGSWLANARDATYEDSNGPHQAGYPNELGARTAVETIKASSALNVYDVRRPSGMVRSLFDLWNSTFHWFYRSLLFAAAASALACVFSRRTTLFAATPMLVFLANFAMMAVLIAPYGRYLQILDYLLVVQIALAYPAWASAAVWSLTRFGAGRIPQKSASLKAFEPRSRRMNSHP